METCGMCGARLTDKDELTHHNELMHPNMRGGVAGKKAGEAARQERAEKKAEQKPMT